MLRCPYGHGIPIERYSNNPTEESNQIEYQAMMEVQNWAPHRSKTIFVFSLQFVLLLERDDVSIVAG